MNARFANRLVLGLLCALFCGSESACDPGGAQSPAADSDQYKALEKQLLLNRVEFASKQYTDPVAAEGTLFLYNQAGSKPALHGYRKSANRHVDYTFPVPYGSLPGFKASDALVVPRNALDSRTFDAYAADQPKALLGSITLNDFVDASCVFRGTVYLAVREASGTQLHKWIPGSPTTPVLSLSGVTGRNPLGDVRAIGVTGSVLMLIADNRIWKIDLGTQRATFVRDLSLIAGEIDLFPDGVLYTTFSDLVFIDATTMQETTLSERILDNAYRLNASFANAHYYVEGHARYGRYILYRGKSGIFAYDMTANLVQPVLLDPLPTSPKDEPVIYRYPVVLESGFLYVVGLQGFDGTIYEVDLNQVLR